MDRHNNILWRRECWDSEPFVSLAQRHNIESHPSVLTHPSGLSRMAASSVSPTQKWYKRIVNSTRQQMVLVGMNTDFLLQ